MNMTLPASAVVPAIGSDLLKIKGIDHIELYVGNAFQAAYFYRLALGFSIVAYAGPETGVRDRSSFVLRQNDIQIILTAPIDPQGSIAQQVNRHGDGVKDIAFRVENALYALEESVRRGAKPIGAPEVFQDPQGNVVKTTIAAYGDTVHSFIQRDRDTGDFSLGYHAIETPLSAISTGLIEIDHLAVNVESGSVDQWVEFYREIMGFHQSQQQDISTEYSAMNVRVVQSCTGQIKFTIVEPAPGKRKSQIEEFLNLYDGPGVQHIALSSENIVETLQTLRHKGVEFVHTPSNYYDTLEDRVGRIDEDIASLKELNILVDRDEWGYLLQRFTKPLQSRPTLFLEVIQRKKAQGFGAGNIKALFEAIEREQALRGNF
jgi:4-hydroxyphenylpyruvate dioxygenase